MVLTGDEFRDVFDDEDMAYKYAKKMNGEAVCVYYIPFEEHFIGMDESDGEFMGWEIMRDGTYYDASECIEEVGELNGN